MALLHKNEVEEGLGSLPDWHRVGNSIQKTYTLGSFLKAMEFVNRVAGEAEAADHHPDLTIKYQKVGLSLSTHSEGGITSKDLDLAEKIEALAQKVSSDQQGVEKHVYHAGC